MKRLHLNTRDFAEDLACLVLAALGAGVVAVSAGGTLRAVAILLAGLCLGALAMGLRLCVEDARHNKDGR